MWPILLVSVLIWAIGLYRLLIVHTCASAHAAFRKRMSAGPYGQTAAFIEPFARLSRRLENRSMAPEYAYRSFLLEVVPRLQDGFGAMKTLIATAPLLGLLGTVSGMVRTFDIIMQYGIGNPHMMAEGISVALLTTQAGLMVAFPGMLFHNYVAGRKNALIHKLMRDGERVVNL